jgi:selenocysteine-specific elongation factor
MERRVILGTAGHIDHGKTALVRALTGIDTDRLPEEKKRGITIDLGFAPLVLDQARTIGIVDVPGHEAFVRTMLAGASGIDLALLVVAADEGVMPQTREHLEILSLLDIPKGVVAITKSDLVDADWLTLIVEDVRTLLRDTRFRDCEIIPVSAATGTGIDDLKAAISSLAQSGDERAADDLFRMPVDRAFSVKGTGTVVTGTVWSGSITKDSAVIVQPSGKRVRVRGIETHGMPVTTAIPGTRAAIALAGCEVSDVERGMTLVAERAMEPSREVEVSLSTAIDLSPRMRFRFHIGTSETEARFAHAFESGGVIVARAMLTEPVIARAGDRFVIRMASPAMTVGGGHVIDPHPPRWRKSHANLRYHSDPAERLARILEAEQMRGVDIERIPERTGLAPSRVQEAIAGLGAVSTGANVIARGVYERLEQELAGSIAIEMANHPLERGVSLEKVRSSTRTSSAVMNYVVDRLQLKGVLEVEGPVARPAGWNFQLREEEEVLRNAILHDICVRPVEPPSVAELSGKFGTSTVAMLRMMERDGSVERVSDDRYYGRNAVEGMVGALRSTLEPGRSYSPSELREVLGVSRKYLIPFLEFCDRKGVTVRGGQGRMLKQSND